MPITTMPCELLTHIARLVPCNHPLQLLAFANVSHQLSISVDDLWKPCYLAWLGPGSDSQKCTKPQHWRTLTTTALNKVLGGGTCFVVAELLVENYRYSRDINYPQPLLVAEMQELFPTATKQTVLQALYLTRPLWTAAASAQGEQCSFKNNRFKHDETPYYALEKKGVLPPSLPVLPEVALVAYVPSVRCALPQKPRDDAIPFWTSVLPQRMHQQQRLLRAVTYATAGRPDAIEVKHFVLPPHRNRHDKSPAYFDIPLAHFPENQRKPSSTEIKATRGTGTQTYLVPATGTPADFINELASNAHVPTLLLFAHECADVLDLTEWLRLLNSWRPNSLLGYSLCATHALSQSFDTTIYGAHGLDYILAVRLDTLRTVISWEEANPGVALDRHVLTNQLSIAPDEVERMWQMRQRVSGRTGANGPKTGGRSHYPGEALPLARHWEAR